MRNGKLIWHIACDESGVDGARFYGFGSLWMKWQRRGDFVREIRKLREYHNYFDEIKWQKANTKRYSKFYEDLIELFFTKNWLAFHCIIVQKSMVDKSFHDGDYDLARRKHFTKLISTKIGNVLGVHKSRECEFRVEVDPIASRYKKADEAFHVIANNEIMLKFRIDNPIKSVVTKDSKDSEQIQISDLLLGAVMAAWQGKASSKGKLKMQKMIGSYLGWPDLSSDTKPSERKFNIWYFYDPTQGPRAVSTRVVELKHPLPSSK